MDIPKQITDLLNRAEYHHRRTIELYKEAIEAQQELLEQAMRKKNDKLLNRTQAIELLWFTTHQALKNWENKVADLGYLNFQNNKILRSEVLRFLEDYQSGKLHAKLRKAGRR